MEDVATAHPAVREAMAFAIRHPTLGEAVGLAIVLESGAAAPNLAALKKEAFEGKLAPAKWPELLEVSSCAARG